MNPFNEDLRTMIDTIPVTMQATAPDYMSGTLITQGLLSYEDGVLVIEYQTVDREWQKAPPKEVRLEPGDIGGIEFQSWYFVAYITIRPRKLTFFEGLPGVDGSDLRMKVQWKHVSAARQFVAQVRLDHSMARLERLEGMGSEKPRIGNR